MENIKIEDKRFYIEYKDKKYAISSTLNFETYKKIQSTLSTVDDETNIELLFEKLSELYYEILSNANDITREEVNEFVNNLGPTYALTVLVQIQNQINKIAVDFINFTIPAQKIHKRKKK